MNSEVAGDNVSTEPARTRGERLFPQRWDRRYWHLTQLRRAIQAVVSDELTGVHDARLVDYGCGNMPYRRLFAPHVGEYVGCDFPGNELAHVILPGDGTLPLQRESVDIVLSSQVLEHVADPPTYLRESHRVLRSSGMLILSTHGLWRYHPDPFDFWRWTSEGLRRQIERGGFEIRQFRGVMAPASTALQLWQDSVLLGIPRVFRGAFIFLLQQLIATADRLSSDSARERDACVYLVVAVKRGNGPSPQSHDEPL